MKCSGWLSLLVLVAVSSIGYGLDRLLMYEGLSRWYLMAVSDILTGIVAGGLFLYVARHERAHRDQVDERMRTVAELNHHIRNSLQVIKLCGAETPLSSPNNRPLQLIKESADRIEWALREVLPRYPIEETITRQPKIGFSAVPSPASGLKAFSSRRREERLD
ncbi:MAG TPA: hypothetical protein VIX19_08430 [Terriglobales bacterium]